MKNEREKTKSYSLKKQILSVAVIKSLSKLLNIAMIPTVKQSLFVLFILICLTKSKKNSQERDFSKHLTTTAGGLARDFCLLRLFSTFLQIWILNMHTVCLKTRRCPAGSLCLKWVQIPFGKAGRVVRHKAALVLSIIIPRAQFVSGSLVRCAVLRLLMTTPISFLPRLEVR